MKKDDDRFQGRQDKKWLPDRVYRFIQEHQLVFPDDVVLAAVSGGADSLALLLVLHHLSERLDVHLSCVHIHHGIRDITADMDSDFVRSWCRKLDIPFYFRKISVPEQARQSGAGLELAAREARQQIYRDMTKKIARRDQLDNTLIKVALAHHMDDQAETLLLHLGRGSGLDGLVGMKPSDGFFIRPLLSCRRAEIEKWLSDQDIEWRHDETNDEDFTIRNRLRHQVIPSWSSALGSDPTPLLYRTSQNLAEDRDYLESVSRTMLSQCKRANRIAVEPFQMLHPAIQARVFRQFWRDATNLSHELERVHIEAIRRWLPCAKTGQGLDLPGYRLVLMQGEIRLYRSGKDENDRDADLPEKLNVPGVTRVQARGITIFAKFVENVDSFGYNGAMEYFRYDRIKDCDIRTGRPDDRICLKRGNTMLLHDYLDQKRIPEDRRKQLLVLARGHDIAWIFGYGTGKPFTASPENSEPGSCIQIQLVHDV
jgi:tRNA(Ile)-lysidine synthase